MDIPGYIEKHVNLERNKIFHFEDSMVLYGIYNSETIEKLINTIQKMHKTTWNDNLFVGKLNKWFQWYLSKDRAVHNAINSMLYVTTLREKYVKMYVKFISQLKIKASVIWVLLKGYLLISLLPPMKLKEVLNDIQKAIQITNPDYDIL